MNPSQIKRVEAPVSLVNPWADHAADRRVVAGATAATSQPDELTLPLNCTQWTQLTLICVCEGGDHYSVQLWWWYAGAARWVRDAGFGTKVISGSETSAFVVATAAASGFYLQLEDVSEGASASIWAEADK